MSESTVEQLELVDSNSVDNNQAIYSYIPRVNDKPILHLAIGSSDWDPTSEQLNAIASKWSHLLGVEYGGIQVTKSNMRVLDQAELSIVRIAVESYQED